jgi:hypothetical protein
MSNGRTSEGVLPILSLTANVSAVVVLLFLKGDVACAPMFATIGPESQPPLCEISEAPCPTEPIVVTPRDLPAYSRLLFREGSRATNGDVVFLLGSELLT